MDTKMTIRMGRTLVVRDIGGGDVELAVVIVTPWGTTEHALCRSTKPDTSGAILTPDAIRDAARRWNEEHERETEIEIRFN